MPAIIPPQAPQNGEKLRGGYYTPLSVATWLSNWAVRSPDDTILEPSCGDGIFLRAAAHRLSAVGCDHTNIGRRMAAVELVTQEASRAIQHFTAALPYATPPQISIGDFFRWLLFNPQARFSVALGNPPFIRYQNFPEPSRTLAMQMMRQQGLKPNKLTNVWVPFIVAATSRLQPGGRLAMVVPAELLQVSYASQLRLFLTDRFHRIEVTACNEMFFDGAEQEVVLLLADGKLEKPSPTNQCQINMTEFATLEQLLKSQPGSKPAETKTVQHENEKWLKYFLSPREIEFMRQVRQAPTVASLHHHAEVNVGVVTGENAFFVLSKEQVRAHDLKGYVRPLVGRSAQLQGSQFTKTDLAHLVRDNNRSFLLYVPPNGTAQLKASMQKYIARGEREKIHTGYKCSIRDPWYSVPSVWTPSAFLFRQIYDFPRPVLNLTRATSTDTIHRMTCRESPEAVITNLYTHLSAASAEIEGRSYGGGVLELEPTEAEKLLLPRTLAAGVPLSEIDAMVRSGHLAEALALNDRHILIDNIGLTKEECTMLREIWTKMRERRRARSRRK
ncbi:MAG TPA: class I SAM-dependent methyltransferase [Clostridia bacterium]|nr:class I SAM-dependent methyltransferase [Clostridia bacterium]